MIFKSTSAYISRIFQGIFQPGHNDPVKINIILANSGDNKPYQYKYDYSGGSVVSQVLTTFISREASVEHGHGILQKDWVILWNGATSLGVFEVIGLSEDGEIQIQLDSSVNPINITHIQKATYPLAPGQDEMEWSDGQEVQWSDDSVVYW